MTTVTNMVVCNSIPCVPYATVNGLNRATLTTTVYKTNVTETKYRTKLDTVTVDALLTRVSLAIIYLYKIVARVSLARIYQYKIVGRVSLSRIYKYNLQARVSLSRIYQYKIVGRISLSRIYKYNLVGRISLSRIYKYNILSRISLSRIYKYSILGRISLSRVYKYNIAARVSLSRIYKYSIVSRISLSRVYKYNIATRVSLSRIYKYNILAQVSLSRIFKYNSLGRTSLSRIYKYGILSRVSLSRVYIYNLKSITTPSFSSLSFSPTSFTVVPTPTPTTGGGKSKKPHKWRDYIARLVRSSKRFFAIRTSSKAELQLIEPEIILTRVSLPLTLVYNILAPVIIAPPPPITKAASIQPENPILDIPLPVISAESLPASIVQNITHLEPYQVADGQHIESQFIPLIKPRAKINSKAAAVLLNLMIISELEELV